jgi:hypothetical protein
MAFLLGAALLSPILLALGESQLLDQESALGRAVWTVLAGDPSRLSSGLGHGSTPLVPSDDNRLTATS